MFADKAVRSRAIDANVGVFSQKIFPLRNKIYNPVAAGSPRPLPPRGMARIHQHFLDGSHQSRVSRGLNTPLMLLQESKPPEFFFLRNHSRHSGRRGIRARRVDERKYSIVSHGIEQADRLLKIIIRLARKT